MELVEKQRRELGRSRSRGDFQLTLKMLEELKAKAKQTQAAPPCVSVVAAST